MAEPRTPTPSAFARASAEVRGVRLRSDLAVEEIAAPEGLAPESLALAADVRPVQGDPESASATGRFVLLHDPDAPHAWGGPWRIVCFAQAPLDTDIGSDPLLADVAWSWLVDALAAHRAGYHSASGTATKIISKGFGTLRDEGDGSQIELRASWSPHAPLGAHVEAWAELVCMLAGLPPGSEEIAVISTRRTMRG
ncbi:DUF3000 domain-containing protein [Microbacterium sp. BWT-B31]|uniref:DUF3000 domain-containing protein n=1 Tax=Microbacterium sp. BWT-B31 TaxID=3232072 RepID=UPI003527D484